MYNRDAQCHSHCNFVRNGLPLAVQKRLAAEIWGSPDAVDAVGAYTSMNPSKARMAKWSLLRKELHDSLSLCNWMGPWVASPLKERGYRGDDSVESMLYSLATGDKKNRQELDRMAERIFVLHRALTIRDMGTKEMRTKHDFMPEWVFTDKSGKPPFTKGPFTWTGTTSKWPSTCFTTRWAGTGLRERPLPRPTARSVWKRSPRRWSSRSCWPDGPAVKKAENVVAVNRGKEGDSAQGPSPR